MQKKESKIITAKSRPAIVPADTATAVTSPGGVTTTIWVQLLGADNNKSLTGALIIGNTYLLNTQDAITYDGIHHEIPLALRYPLVALPTLAMRTPWVA